MTGRRWHGLEVRVPVASAEPVAALLWDHGVTGIEESPEDPGRFIAFSERRWNLDAIGELVRGCVRAGGGDTERIELRTRIVEEEDWLRIWKRDWKPTPLGERLVVVPAWWTGTVPADRHPVRIEPGQAFGTGTHESTALAWELLESAITGDDPPRRLLDIGCGTGVLGIGALLLAAERDRPLRVVATEADGQAVASLRPNLTLNRSAAPAVIRATSIPLRAGSVDLAVANLTAAEHRVVDGDLARVLGSGGRRAILSGFLAGQDTEACNRWRDRGFTVSREISRGEWRAVLLTS